MRHLVFPPKLRILLATVAIAGWTSPAFACGPIRCYPGEFIPHEGGRIPANAPALGWRPPHDDQSSTGRPDVRLFRLDEPEQIDVEIVEDDADQTIVQLRPAVLVAGARYRLEADARSCTTAPVEFAVVETAPLPTELGTPEVVDSATEPLNVWTYSGTCYAPLPVTRLSIALQRTAAADAWADLLVYSFLVDAEVWAPSLEQSLPGDETLVFSECTGRTPPTVDPGIQDRGLALGEHTVRIDARLLGSATLRSSELTFELTCERGDTIPTVPDSAATPPRSAASCSASMGPSSRAATVLMLLLAVVLLAWRRTAA